MLQFVIYVQKLCLEEKKNTDGTSTFGAECVYMYGEIDTAVYNNKTKKVKKKKQNFTIFLRKNAAKKVCKK